jgi:hypothetical protein
MRAAIVWFIAAGCGAAAQGECPSDRPLQEEDLPCMCGDRKTDAVFDCGQTWCFPEQDLVECPDTGGSR